MFEMMRRNTKIIMWITAGAFVLLIFLAWGAQYQIGTPGGIRERGIIGRVNGQPINGRAYSDRILQARESYRQQGQDPDHAEDVQIQLQAWDALIGEILIRQEIERLGITVSDQEVLQAIRNQPLPAFTQSPEFQTDGQFDYSKYLAAMQDPRINWLPFERYYREEIPKQKLQHLVVSSVKVSEADIRRQFEMENTSAKVSYVSLQARDFPVDPDSLSDSDVRAYYEAHREDYATDAQAWVEFARLEKVPTATDTLDALEMIRLAEQEAKEGEDFGVLVSAYSDAPRQLQGGEFGAYMPRDQFTAPKVREAAFGLEIGEVSEILVEADGYHMIRVEDRRTNGEVEEAKIADIFVPISMSGETIIELRDRATSLANGSVDYGGDLSAAAAELYPDQEIVEAGPFGRGGYAPSLGRLGQINGFQDWAFNAKIGTVRTVEGPDALYVVHLTKRRAAGISPFDEVAERVRTHCANRQQAEMASARAEEVLRLAREGMPLEEAAASDSLATFGTTEEFSRRGYARGLGNDPTLMARVFTDPIGLVPEVITTRRGAYIIEILSRTDPDESLYADQREKIRAQIMQRRRGDVLSRWMEDLHSRAQIQDFRGEVGI